MHIRANFKASPRSDGVRGAHDARVFEKKIDLMEVSGVNMYRGYLQYLKCRRNEITTPKITRRVEVCEALKMKKWGESMWWVAGAMSQEKRKTRKRKSRDKSLIRRTQS